MREPNELVSDETKPDFSDAEIATLRSNDFFANSIRTMCIARR